jgi:hemerythrin
MPLIDWDNNLSTGFRAIDLEHKRLVDLVNELHEYLVSGSSLNLINAVFEQIARHTGGHFRHEEKLMLESNYPDLTKHRLAHQELEKQIAELLRSIEAGAPVFSQDLVDFLKNWLVNHILTMDKALGEYLSKQS